jgi:hypothetical protein
MSHEQPFQLVIVLDAEQHSHRAAIPRDDPRNIRKQLSDLLFQCDLF